MGIAEPLAPLPVPSLQDRWHSVSQKAILPNQGSGRHAGQFPSLLTSPQALMFLLQEVSTHLDRALSWSQIDPIVRTKDVKRLLIDPNLQWPLDLDMHSLRSLSYLYFYLHTGHFVFFYKSCEFTQLMIVIIPTKSLSSPGVLCHSFLLSCMPHTLILI